MELKIQRKNGIPLYMQIKGQILELIRTGKLVRGEQLPTERQLAEELSISRNTVSMAFRELESEGVVVSHQGRGTFVATGDQVFRREGRKERVLKMIDLAIEEAAELGFSIDEFTSIVTARVREKKAVLRQVKVAFIECNREQLEFYSKQLHLGSGVAIIPVILDDLIADSGRVNGLLAEVDLVVTTVYHVEQVFEVLDNKKKLVAVALEPEVSTIVRIARSIPAKKAILVCLTDKFAHSVRLYLGQCGIDAANLSHTITMDRKELTSLLADVETVLVSPGRKKDVEDLVRPGTEVIEFILKPDQGSISRLNSVILELKKAT
ncbi:MAG TPA: GntR family transcriptional regulator [Firmicutes bacterium]|nr:GntR family transcriptional regulator [Bacillota bacterium]